MNSEMRPTPPSEAIESTSKPEQEQAVEQETTTNRFPSPDQFIEVLEQRGLAAHANAYRKVLDISESVREAGGRVLLVGGSVRDVFFGKISKDFDIEIYGLEPEQIEELVSAHGKVTEVGKAFGVLTVALEGKMSIDVSLPRKDSKTGEGHRGFDVETDPHMSIEEAAKRRDFTMNALAADPLTGETYDFFGGIDDIKHRRLCVTDVERFKDDPLRVMRGLQFIGRFGLSIDKDSLSVLIEMAPKLKELPIERIGKEWHKLLIKSVKPSMGLSAGMTLGVFDTLHPELPPLAETPQEKAWHPEGDVWMHTLMSVDKAAELARQEEMNEAETFTVLLAALCHDIGKPAVTAEEDGRIRSRGHEPAGEEPTKKFLASIAADSGTSEKVVNLVTNHMMPSELWANEVVRGQKVSDGAIRRLAQRIYPATIRELVLVAKADHLGRGPFDEPESLETMLMPPDEYPAADWLIQRARELKVEENKPTPLTTGREWLRFGFKQGAEIGELNRLANDLRDDKGWSREDVLWAVHAAPSSQEGLQKLRDILADQNE